MKNKDLHYEIIEDGSKPSQSNSRELVAGAVEPQRDASADLKLNPDTADKRTGVGLALGAVVIAGGLLSLFVKNQTAVYVVCSLVLAAVIAAVVVMCVLAKKQNGAHYCCFVRDVNEVKCLSVIDDRAVLFTGGTAYVVDGDEVISLDRDGFVTYLDGECTGLYAAMCASRELVSFADDGAHFVKNEKGGGHAVYIEDGKIVAVTSEQPFETNDTDGDTGERVVKTKTFYKTDPQEDFEWEIPEFVKAALSARGIDVN